MYSLRCPQNLLYLGTLVIDDLTSFRGIVWTEWRREGCPLSSPLRSLCAMIYDSTDQKWRVIGSIKAILERRESGVRFVAPHKEVTSGGAMGHGFNDSPGQTTCASPPSPAACTLAEAVHVVGSSTSRRCVNCNSVKSDG